MKKAILLPCFLLGGLSLMAQSLHQSHHPLSQQNIKSRRIVNSILANQMANSNAANKPTTIQQRVIAQTFIDNDSVAQDSLKYKYSGTRTSKYDFNNVDFNYNTQFKSDFLPLTLSAYTNPNAYLQADSIMEYQQDTLRSSSNAFYSSDNKVDSFYDRYFYGNGATMSVKTLHRYDGQGNLTQVLAAENNGGSTPYDTNNVTKYFYNSTSHLTSDTIYSVNNGMLNANSAETYHYNQSGLIDSIYIYEIGTAPVLYSIYSINYNSDGKLTNLNGYEFDGNMDISNFQSDTFGYVANVPFYVYHGSLTVDIANVNVDGQITFKTLGANNLPDTVGILLFDQNGAYDSLIYKYTYNSYNNPVTFVGTELSDSSYVGQYNFYYETFDDTPPPTPIAIKDVKNNKDFSIYPNPFDNKLNIDWKGANAYQTKIALVNILGQTVYSSNQNLVTGTNTIDIPSLIKGNYILLIQDAKGATWKSQLVKH